MVPGAPRAPSSAWAGWQPLFLLTLEALLPSPAWVCPVRCKCSSQDRSVLCHRQNLAAVPGRIPPACELLDLSHNRLRTLQQGMFSRLQALKELDLSENVISNIEPGAFNSLQRLMTLRLRGNELKIVLAGVFAGLPSLTVLDLSQNKIVIFLDHAFQDLASLRHLEASNNHLVFISPRAFGGLRQLRQLTLERCNLTGVPTGALGQLPHLGELRLKVLNISVLRDYSFRRLPRLRALEISRWPFLATVEPHSLLGLNLSSLAITKCNLSIIPYEALQPLTYLRCLDLSHNPIAAIHGGRLAQLLRLQELHLVGGQLATVAAHAFWGLSHLRLLNVSDNALQTLEEGAFHTVGNLETLRLDGNPLACDCRLLWVVRRRRRLSFEGRQPACASPALVRGRRFKDFSDILPSGHFTCRRAKIQPEAPQWVSVEEGSKARLRCQGDGDPMPTITWLSPRQAWLDAGLRGRVRVLPDGTLEIFYALVQDSGTYYCVASNVAGNDTMAAHLHVYDPSRWANDTFPLANMSANGLGAPVVPLPGLGMLLGAVAMGAVPFLSSVAVCFLFIFLWSKGRGRVKHHATFEFVPRSPGAPRGKPSHGGRLAMRFT
ncbi:leucine-rich repeat and immunoglobulin-like domain-containing nogo receptor-interacting protein 4 [Alligator mississippiensis]|uniref:Ig-like domain-containing protein n=1 Tax=Alligator mississippiensis TaxID=8496 RepID=A0A151M5B6_ALLMI|nr:leucine-rich repeat and immunoglobulin-like domain-containing nogo receptor-interacting protein 4 [Alligator mississippiensis]KYO19709.1 hypothetical protein Y1Q_0012356 [Alligator mississippiensis]